MGSPREGYEAFCATRCELSHALRPPMGRAMKLNPAEIHCLNLDLISMQSTG